MPLQTSYSSIMAVAHAGMVVNTELANVISRTVTAGEIGFGQVAVQGASDHTVRPSDVGLTDFVGITVRDQAVDPQTPNVYGIGSTAAVMTKGVIWVVAGEAVAAGDPVYFDPTSFGAFLNDAAGGNAILIPNARFDTSATAQGQLVKLRLG